MVFGMIEHAQKNLHEDSRNQVNLHLILYVRPRYQSRLPGLVIIVAGH